MLGNFENTDQNFDDKNNSENIDLMTSEISDKNLLKDGFALRLRNPRFYCFLNTALNSVISNEIMIDRILNPSNEMSSIFQILSGHLNIEKITEISGENLISLLEFFAYDTEGCSENHGHQCFSVVRKNIKEKIIELKIIEEIKFLIMKLTPAFSNVYCNSHYNFLI